MGDIATVQNGFPFKSELFDRENGTPLIRIRDVNRAITEHRYNGDFDPEFIVRHGDIIVGMDGDFKAARWKGADALLNQRVCRLKLKTESYSNAFFFLCLQPYLNAINAETSSVTVKHLSSKSVEEIPLPLPPLPEQHRIVAKIEALFSELEAGQDSLTRAQAQLKLYRQSLLDSAVSGDLLFRGGHRELPFESDAITPLFDVVSDVGQGWSPRCENRKASSDNEWAVIKTTAIQHLVFDGSEHKALPPSLEPRENLELKEGDLLITRAGPRSRVGVACLVRNVRPRLLLCDKAYRLNVDTAKVKPEYLEIVLNSPKVLWAIEEIKTGINDSGVNLTQSKFLTIGFPLPSISEQEKTLVLLSAILSNLAAMETEITTALAKLSALRQSILKKAFSGQLVPQDPSDEPANALLARLRDTTPTPRRKTKA